MLQSISVDIHVRSFSALCLVGIHSILLARDAGISVEHRGDGGWRSDCVEISWPPKNTWLIAGRSHVLEGNGYTIATCIRRALGSTSYVVAGHCRPSNLRIRNLQGTFLCNNLEVRRDATILSGNTFLRPLCYFFSDHVLCLWVSLSLCDIESSTSALSVEGHLINLIHVIICAFVGWEAAAVPTSSRKCLSPLLMRHVDDVKVGEKRVSVSTQMLNFVVT